MEQSFSNPVNPLFRKLSEGPHVLIVSIGTDLRCLVKVFIYVFNPSSLSLSMSLSVFSKIGFTNFGFFSLKKKFKEKRNFSFLNYSMIRGVISRNH